MCYEEDEAARSKRRGKKVGRRSWDIYLAELIPVRSKEKLKATQESYEESLHADFVGANRSHNSKRGAQDGRSNGQQFFGRRGPCFSSWKLLAAHLE